jgi:hypothetical protein
MVGATLDQMIMASNELALLPRFSFGKHAKMLITEVPADYLDWITRQAKMDEDVSHAAIAELRRREIDVDKAPPRLAY